MKSTLKFSQLLLVFFLVGSLAAPAAFSAPTQPDAMHPALAELALAAPDQPVRVIVQKVGDSGEAERQVHQFGGQIYRDLPIINAFAAELTAASAARLAKSSAVRWMSPDGETFTTAENMEQEIYYLYNDPVTISGDTPSHDMLPLGTALPESASLFNYDTDRDSDLGLTIQRGGSGAFETDSTKIQRWQLPAFTEDYVVEASLDLKVYLAMAGFQTGLPATVNAYILDRDGGSASVVAQGAFELETWPENWSRKNLRFGAIEYTFPAGHQLEIALTVDGSSAGDMMISYGTAPQPAHLVVGQRVEWPIHFIETIGAPAVWAQGYDGDGVTVAVIDSGSRTIKDMREATGTKSRYIVKVSVRVDTAEWKDEFGHGTYVAGLIGSNGRQSDGKYVGVAPEVNFAGVRVNDEYGMAAESDVVAGLQWVLENKDEYNIRVVNLSLNSTVAQPYHLSPLDLALEILWFNNIVVVAAAGNNGDDDPGMLFAPANDPFAIVVGATDEMATADPSDDQLAAFSAYGTTMEGHAKPDLAAPGVDLVSSMHSQSNFRWDYNDHVIQTIGSGGSVTNKHFLASGTSASAAVVSGVVALLLEAQPNLSPDQVKWLLIETATPLPGVEGAGAGSVHAENLINAALSYGDPADVPSANQGTMPHMTLAQMALMAYWASENGGDSIIWDLVNWNSVNWNSVNWNSVNWNSVNWNSVNWNSVNWNSVNWNSVNWNSVNWNSVNWNSVNWNSVNWNSVNWNSVNWNSIDLDY